MAARHKKRRAGPLGRMPNSRFQRGSPLAGCIGRTRAWHKCEASGAGMQKKA